MSLEEYLNVEIIDVSPKYLSFDVDQVISTAAMSTVSSKDFIKKLEKAKTQNKFNEYISATKDAIERGYASITTTPILYLNIVGTRISDLFFTAIPFSSSMVLSQRVVKPKSFYIPKQLESHSTILRSMLDFYWELINNGIKPEVARRILPLSTPSHIFMQLPFESLGNVYKYYNVNRDYIPVEIEIILKKLNNIDSKLFKSVISSPQYNFSIRSIFRPYEEIKYDELGVLYEKKFELEEFLKNLKEKLEDYWKRRDRNLAYELQELIARNSFRYSVIVSFPCSLACYNELKRHRTLDIHTESIYSAVQRALRDEKNIYVPSVIREKKKYYKRYIELTHDALGKYEDIKDKYGERYAAYFIPQNIIIRSIVEIDLNNLINFFLFYRIRSCVTAEFEIREKVRKLPHLLDPLLKDLLLYKNVVPFSKCIIGYCPEPAKKSCSIYRIIFK